MPFICQILASAAPGNAIDLLVDRSQYCQDITNHFTWDPPDLDSLSIASSAHPVDLEPRMLRTQSTRRPVVCKRRSGPTDNEERTQVAMPAASAKSRQVQDLEKQLAQAKQQLSQLRPQSGDGSSEEGPSNSRSDLLIQEYEPPPRKRQKISAPQDFSAVRSDLRHYGHGIFKPPQSFSQQNPQIVSRVPVVRGDDLPDLPPKHVADELVYLYRISFHATFPLLDWESFSREYESVYRQRSLRESPRVWSALLFAVFACGTLPQHLRDGQDYSDKSRNLINLSSDDMTLDHVRTALLTSVFLVELNRKSAGWTWLGIAVRIGQDIGLHIPNAGRPFIDQVVNRPVWWTVYVCDRYVLDLVH
ncbi:MAG: hypothetical protein Q9181_000788 [Wetmoreana brouardii]